MKKEKYLFIINNQVPGPTKKNKALEPEKRKKKPPSARDELKIKTWDPDSISLNTRSAKIYLHQKELYQKISSVLNKLKLHTRYLASQALSIRVRKHLGVVIDTGKRKKTP